MNELELLKIVSSWQKSKNKVAIVTVIETWGSSPRPVGSIMAVNDNNEIIGSVSGGCIEAAVFSEALEVIKTGNQKILDFGITNSQAWDVGLTCGGKIKVFIEKVQDNEKRIA